MNQVDWKDVAYLSNYINGELHVREADGTMYMGPVRDIQVTNERVVISCEWMAKSVDRGQRWLPSDYDGVTFSTTVDIFREDDDIVFRENTTHHRLTMDHTAISICVPPAVFAL